ncbi:PE domain-containing protein [Mycobacterium tuberculosis]
MDSLSHDPAAGDIGSQLVEIGSRGLAAGNAATMPTMTGLVPAGGEEVSAQAVMAFATEAASMIASNTAAQPRTSASIDEAAPLTSPRVFVE